MKTTIQHTPFLRFLFLCSVMLLLGIILQSCNGHRACNAYPNRVSSNTKRHKPVWGSVSIAKRHKSLQLKSVKSQKVKVTSEEPARTKTRKARTSRSKSTRNQNIRGVYPKRHRSLKRGTIRAVFD
jgi:hypothetical protein